MPTFDPYHLWLGIPSQEQPPNHYRLLGVPLFEPNAAVIEAAADRQMGHLRGYQAGKHSAESQRLLNEVAAARVCLLNPQRRAAYDAELRAAIGELADVAASPAVEDWTAAVAPSPASTRPRKRPSATRAALTLAGILAFGFAGLGVAMWAMRAASKQDTDYSETGREYSKTKADYSRTATKTPAVAAKQQKIEWTDLLSLVDLNRDARSGQWTKSSDGLASPSQEAFAPRVEMPTQQDALDYDLQLELTNLGGEGHAAIVLPVGGRACMVALYSPDNQSGLDQVNGVRVHHGNGTERQGTLTIGRHSVLVRVRATTLAAIQVTVDGKEAISWKGQPSALSLHQDWTTRPNVVAIGCHGLRVIYHGVQMRIAQ